MRKKEFVDTQRKSPYIRQMVPLPPWTDKDSFSEALSDVTRRSSVLNADNLKAVADAVNGDGSPARPSTAPAGLGGGTTPARRLSSLPGINTHLLNLASESDDCDGRFSGRR